jgi:RNA polymerase sigma factor (sigma-70 family)
MHSIDPPLTLGRPVRPPAVSLTSIDPSDSVLIGRSLRDPQEFAVIFDRHWPAIHAYCTSRAAAAGEDLAADVFRRAFAHRGRYDRRLQDARPWLYGIATNLLRHHFRASQRRGRADQRVLALAELETVAQPFEQLEAQLLGPRLTAALQSLAEADREALLLYAWAELSYQEIAVALDVPVGTVRSRIHRARARLREHIVLTAQGDPDA